MVWCGAPVLEIIETKSRLQMNESPNCVLVSIYYLPYATEAILHITYTAYTNRFITLMVTAFFNFLSDLFVLFYFRTRRSFHMLTRRTNAVVKNL